MHKGFILCGYPRTGGTLLCRALHATGRFGYAQEYFNAVAIEPEPGRPYPRDRAGQLREIARRGTAANGVYGVKIFSDQFDALHGFDWLSALPAPVFIHLERRDALGQALSQVRAMQSGQWNSGQGVHGTVFYDEAAIREELRRTAHSRARWQMYFARNAIAPLWLTYEELCADLTSVVRRVADHLAVTDLPEPLPCLVDLEPQADSLSDEWRARFIASLRDPSFLDQIDAAPVRTGLRRLLLR